MSWLTDDHGASLRTWILAFLQVQSYVATDIATLQAQMIAHMEKDSSMDMSRLIPLGQKRLVNGQLLRSAHHVHRSRFNNNVPDAMNSNSSGKSRQIGWNLRQLWW